MPLTRIFNKAFAKVILQISAGGSMAYGLWLLNPFNQGAAGSVIKTALSTGSLELIIGALLVLASVWFIVAVQKELVRHMRGTSMAMTILWLFFLVIYVTSNAALAVVPLAAMFVILYGYCFIKSPKNKRVAGTNAPVDQESAGG